jgi:hypothetical protein
MIRLALLVTMFCAGTGTLLALTQDQLDMLHDSGGWEYLVITDAGNGVQTQHVCFDQKGRGPCTGKLILHDDGTFNQIVTGFGKSMNRHGTYTLDGDNMTLVDELGTKDGPYSVKLDVPSSTLEIATVQASVTIKVQLMLEREFRKQSGAAK